MKKKAREDFGEATRASVKKEMAKPRMAKSARDVELDLSAARIASGKLRKNKLRSVLLAVPQGAR
jgi:hypothetical protein